MAPTDNEMGRMAEAIEGLKRSFDALKADQDKTNLAHARDNAEIKAMINEIKLIEAKRQGAESVAKWLIGLVSGGIGAVLTRIAHGM